MYDCSKMEQKERVTFKLSVIIYFHLNDYTGVIRL